MNRLRNQPTRQILLSESFASSSSSSEPSQFVKYSTDMCNAFISADIPLSKISNPIFRGFLQKYTHMDPPDESTLRKYYLPKCYEETINKIRKLCENENIWVSFDETSDSSGRKIVNIIIGVLKDDDVLSEKFFLLACEEISVVNHTTVARVFNDAMHILWPRGVKYDNVLLLLTDAAPYMIKAGEGLSVSYPKMIHVTCVAHALHRVCETIRVLYPNVDKLIANAKKKKL